MDIVIAKRASDLTRTDILIPVGGMPDTVYIAGISTNADGSIKVELQAQEGEFLFAPDDLICVSRKPDSK